MVCQDLGALLHGLQAMQPLELSQNGALAAGGDKMFFIFALFVATFSGCRGHTTTHSPRVDLRDGPSSMPGAYTCIFSFQPYNSTEG